MQPRANPLGPAPIRTRRSPLAQPRAQGSWGRASCVCSPKPGPRRYVHATIPASSSRLALQGTQLGTKWTRLPRNPSLRSPAQTHPNRLYLQSRSPVFPACRSFQHPLFYKEQKHFSTCNASPQKESTFPNLEGKSKGEISFSVVDISLKWQKTISQHFLKPAASSPKFKLTSYSPRSRMPFPLFKFALLLSAAIVEKKRVLSQGWQPYNHEKAAIMIES